MCKEATAAPRTRRPRLPTMPAPQSNPHTSPSGMLSPGFGTTQRNTLNVREPSVCSSSCGGVRYLHARANQQSMTSSGHHWRAHVTYDSISAGSVTRTMTPPTSRHGAHR